MVYVIYLNIKMNVLITVDWLQKKLNKKNLILLDASLDSTMNKELSEHQNKTIPTARYFDIKTKFSNTKSPFPNTIPSS